MVSLSVCSLSVSMLVSLLAQAPAATPPAASVPPEPLAASASQFVSSSWTSQDGLPQNSVLAIARTPDGYLWLATYGGLARFDGVRFTVFTQANTPGLRSDRLRSLAADGSGTLWIGTEHGGIARLKDGVLATVVPQQALPGQFIDALAAGANGDLWVGTDHGLARVIVNAVQP